MIWSKGFGGTETATLGPMLLVARHHSWCVAMLRGQAPADKPSKNLRDSKRQAIDAARELVGSWSSELDRAAAEAL